MSRVCLSCVCLIQARLYQMIITSKAHRMSAYLTSSRNHSHQIITWHALNVTRMTCFQCDSWSLKSIFPCRMKIGIDIPRVRSMRMGFVIPRSTVGKNLGTYRDLAKIYRGFGARDSRLLPWKQYVYNEVNGSPARRNLGIFALNFGMYRGFSTL